MNLDRLHLFTKQLNGLSAVLGLNVPDGLLCATAILVELHTSAEEIINRISTITVSNPPSAIFRQPTTSSFVLKYKA